MAKDLRGFWKPPPEEMGSEARRKAELAHVYRKRGKSPPKKKSAAKSDNFLKCLAWRQIRYLALKNCNGRCQLCGATAHDGVQLHPDHIKPRSTHPELALELNNIQVLCDDCNIGKGAWDDTDWREHMRSI